ncbi:MAG: 4Fe-4S dicluster domain-containing protein [Coriobacteriaceae bacterium]|jgi:molybdopterin-containing oxidoreductase family iron-sulfur binding subunit|nr:4Fe-4S dicluster domain-containing protein [Coriobacteriaceae bacterium]
MTRYGMTIDLNRCFGCQTWAAACKIANNLPIGLNYCVVYTKSDDDWTQDGTAVATGAIANDSAGGTYPDCTLSFFPLQCQHCAAPACAPVCPTGARYRDPDTGIVKTNYDDCIGCDACISGCPYKVNTLITSDAEYYIDIKVGEHDAPPHTTGTVEKCTFCDNLIERGEVPACMQLCPGRARYWGDLDDPGSEPNKAKEGREVMLYKEDQGTGPSVFYLK